MNLDLLRSFLVVVEQGSLNKAAERLRVSQSTLTRQMQSLEQEAGGVLLERGSAGVALTSTGHLLMGKMGPLLEQFDVAMADVRRRARGQSAELRVGYLMSAAKDYLNPALAALRKTHPEVKVKIRDLSPGEQLAALRAGEIDVALIGHAGGVSKCDFYVKTLALTPVLVALPADHPLASKKNIKPVELKKELFIGAGDADLPGYNQWVARLCKRAGFRARFVQDAESFSDGLSLVLTEGAVSLLPGYAGEIHAPGVVFIPLQDPAAKWELVVAWPRGKVSAALRTFIYALPVARRG